MTKRTVRELRQIALAHIRFVMLHSRIPMDMSTPVLDNAAVQFGYPRKPGESDKKLKARLIKNLKEVK